MVRFRTASRTPAPLHQPTPAYQSGSRLLPLFRSSRLRHTQHLEIPHPLLIARHSAAANPFLIAHAHLHSARPSVPTVIFSRFKQNPLALGRRLKIVLVVVDRSIPVGCARVRMGHGLPRTRDGPSSALGRAPEHC